MSPEHYAAYLRAMDIPLWLRRDAVAAPTPAAELAATPSARPVEATTAASPPVPKPAPPKMTDKNPSAAPASSRAAPVSPPEPSQAGIDEDAPNAPAWLLDGPPPDLADAPWEESEQPPVHFFADQPAKPEPPPISGLDWAALRERVSQCRACGLHSTRSQTVFGVGSEQARWLLIGEAPGRDEDAQGEPFVGRAGQLLTAMLSAVGVQREQVYIANILKCRPPQNRNPDYAEMEACTPYLARQIALIQPQLIIALGRFAVQYLLDSKESIARLRGGSHLYQNIPLLVTYHPAYLLRNPADKAKAWEDLQRALQLAAPV